MRLGSILILGLAILAVAVTMSLLGLGCGENKDPCSASSSPVLAVFFSWAGLAGVLASTLLTRWGSGRARTMTVVATAGAYAAWLVFLFRDS